MPLLVLLRIVGHVGSSLHDGPFVGFQNSTAPPYKKDPKRDQYLKTTHVVMVTLFPMTERAAASRTLTEASQKLGRALRLTQRLQYPLIKEYTLNHTRDPTII